MIKSIIIAVVVALLAPYGARAQGVPELECSCSPKTFQFIISLDISLDPFCTQKNDIVSNTGILDATTRCSFAVVRVIPESISEGDGIKEEESIMFEELQPDFAVQNITSIEFKESNEDGDEIRKTTLNYGTPLPLEDGDKVDLVSVSSALDPSLSLEDQMGKVPYSVEIRLYGYNAEDELIINIIRWTYDLSCGSDPIQTGDTIGWITIGKLEGPWPQFCPTVPSPSPSASMSYGSYNKLSKAAKAKAHNSKKGGRKTQQNTA